MNAATRQGRTRAKSRASRRTERKKAKGAGPAPAPLLARFVRGAPSEAEADAHVEAMALDLVAELAFIAQRHRRVAVAAVDADADDRRAVAEALVDQRELLRARDEAERALGLFVDEIGAIAGEDARGDDAAAATAAEAAAELDADVAPEALRGRVADFVVDRSAPAFRGIATLAHVDVGERGLGRDHEPSRGHRRGHAHRAMALIGPPFGFGLGVERIADPHDPPRLQLACADAADQVDVERAHRRAQIGVELGERGGDFAVRASLFLGLGGDERS